MTFDEWQQRNGRAIVERWCDWCDYLVQYGHLYDANFRIPVPQFFFDAYTNGREPGAQIVAYFEDAFNRGQPVQIPDPVPAPPSRSSLGRAYQHGQASQGYGEAALRGFKEAGTNQLKQAGRSFLSKLLSGRW